MKKFLNDLQTELKKLKMNDKEIEEILADHKEMIEEALNQGVSEKELAAKFGEPEKVAKELYEDQQKVDIDMNEYVKGTQYEAIEGYKLLKTLPVQELSEIQIKLISEDLEIYPYDGENIEIHHSRKVDENNYEIKLENGVFTLLRKTSKKGIFEKNNTPDFVVRYPNLGRLKDYKVQTISGDTEVQGVDTNTLKLKSTSGDFELQGIQCETAELSTVSGDYEINKLVAKEVKMSAVSGDFEGKDIEIQGDLDMGTVSGDYEFFNLQADKVTFNSVSGDLEGKEFYVNHIDLKSVSGDIEINNKDKTRVITVGRKKSLSGDININ